MATVFHDARGAPLLEEHDGGAPRWTRGAVRFIIIMINYCGDRETTCLGSYRLD